LPEVVRSVAKEGCRSGRDPYELPCEPGQRVSSAELVRQLEASLSSLHFSHRPLLDEIVDSRLMLSNAAHELPAAERKRLDEAIRRQLRAMPLVADVFATSEFAQGCPEPADESVRALVCRTVAPEQAGFYGVPDGYVVVLKPGSFFSMLQHGTSHGSPYRYDRTVPLLTRYPDGERGKIVQKALFGSFAASLWYALTGEKTEGPYGGPIGVLAR
jgi:hypothetical protein